MVSSSAGQKVLVIDDSPTILQWMSLTLTNYSFTVETSKSIWVAPLIVKFKPDIVIVDVNICRNRNQDGPMIIKTLRNRNSLSTMKFILCSSLEENLLEELSRSCNAHGWIKKTSDPELFIQQFESIINS